MSIEIQIMVKQVGDDIYEATDGQTFRVQGLRRELMQKSLDEEKIRLEQKHCWMEQGELQIPRIVVLGFDNPQQLTLSPDYVSTDQQK